jgi:hypothetical protein
MDWNANMNTIHMDPRHLPALGVPQHLGMVRTPVGMMPPGIGRHGMVGHQAVLRMAHPALAPGQGGMVPGMVPGMSGHQHHQQQHQQQQHLQLQGPIVEDQMEHLAGKLDMLENELRYAWRALDVLSQEYIKMWERLEKMEGLLTEQQTVITQLIDLYTADSSDNADEFDNNGGGGGIASFRGLGFSSTGPSGPNPDESFYKSLNAVHKDSYPNTGDNFNTDNKGQAIVNSPKHTKKPKESGPNSLEYKGTESVEQEMDNKSMSSSMRSTHSGFSEVSEFPVPADNSPTYENLRGGATLLSPCPGQAGQPKRKLPQLPAMQVDSNRRTRKDGYIGEPGPGGSLPAELNRGQPGGERREQSASPGRPHINGKESVRKANSLQPKLATNIFTTEPQAEVQYDTFPRRKKEKKKDKSKEGPEDVPVVGSPLTVIDGNYSFSLTDNGGTEVGQSAGRPRDGRRVEGNDPEGAPGPAPSQRPRGPSVGEAGRHVTMGLPLVQEATAEQEVGSPSEAGQARANSLFQQIQAHSDPTMAGKPRKISLKEKRKLRAEQREHVAELLPRPTETEPAAPEPNKHHSSESDVSMRSDHSVSPKRETEEHGGAQHPNGPAMSEQQAAGRPRSNGINLLPVQQQLLQAQQLAQAKSGSRQFAVSRALGNYRQKQKKEREHGSSNSDSQDELELSFESRHDPAGLDGTLPTLDAKLAEIEEIAEPTRSSDGAAAGGHHIEMARSPKQGSVGSRKHSATESIDTEDEWYKHEMMRLQKLEHDEQVQKSRPPASVGNRASTSSGELLNTKLGPVSAQEQPEEVKRRTSRSHKSEPPDKPPNEPPDKRRGSDSRRMSRRASRKQLLKQEAAINRSSASSATQEEEDDYSSATGSADEDSETQSGADSVDDEEDLPTIGDTEAARGAQARPGQLLILPQQQVLNISSLPTKPDLLLEVTAAAAEAAYPDHLKNGGYGDDGVWYDDKGETGYHAEDGEWYDYMDEIGYYDDSGEWTEYDYTTGYWDDEGEWKQKSADQIAAAQAATNPEEEADHFLWVSEEGINEFSNDQIPSSTLPPVMVIGKLASGSREDHLPPVELYGEVKIRSNGVAHQPCPPSDHQQTSSIPKRKDSLEPIVVNVVSGTDGKDISDEEGVDKKTKGGGGGRWGALVKQRRADIIIELVRN